ncbi:hypothetical protein A2U01_0077639, partial [Trifolium medium]|nr:hypothetical protein [Trifolium medium]
MLMVSWLLLAVGKSFHYTRFR